MKRLIITADDYGLCKPVNEAIEACMAAGILHATCVMMNMPAYREMVPLKARFPQASIGVHWNITYGPPVLPASQVPSLVGANGEFLPKAEIKRRWLLKQLKEEELKAELSAQFQRFCEIGGLPAFWCPHQDIHIFPGLFQKFVAVGLELGIPAMRCHRRIVVSPKYTQQEYFARHPLYWLKGKQVEQWSRWARELGMRMPDGQVQKRGYKELDLAGTMKLIDRLQYPSAHAIVEMTIHPATSIDADLSGSSLTVSRIREYQVFSDRHLKEYVQSRGIQLVGYEALG